MNQARIYGEELYQPPLDLDSRLAQEGFPGAHHHIFVRFSDKYFFGRST